MIRLNRRTGKESGETVFVNESLIVDFYSDADGGSTVEFMSGQPRNMYVTQSPDEIMFMIEGKKK